MLNDQGITSPHNEPQRSPGFFQKQPEMFCKKSCSEKYRKFHRKTPVLESLFNNVAGPQTMIIMVALFCYSSVFFFSERYHFVFSFAHFFNKIVKPKCKTPFNKLLKGYICYMFLIQGIQN